MSQHFIAGCLAVFAGCALLGILPGAVLAARARSPLAAAGAAVLGLAAAAILANGAADLW